MTDAPAHNWRSAASRMFGELAVIVVGVLIALWADGWVQRQAEREVEASRIVALGENVAATRDRLTDARAEAAAAGDALAEIAYWETLPGPEADETLLQGLLFGPTFSPEMNVYEDLKSSGELALLRSADLRRALARMDAALEQVALLQDDMVAVQQLNYDPYVIRELALDGSFGEYLGLDDLPRSPTSGPGDLRELRNLALFKLDLVGLLLGALDDAEEALVAVNRALSP